MTSSRAKTVMAWWDDKMIALQEASIVKQADPLADTRYTWWSNLVPPIIDPEWWRWKRALFTDDGDDEAGPGWEAMWSHRLRAGAYSLGARLKWNWLTDWEPDPLSSVRWLYRFNCRRRGHPAGIVYYSSGYEPDTHCKDCGMDIG